MLSAVSKWNTYRKNREKYEYYLKRFLKETKLKNFTSLIELDDETVQDLLEKYIMMLRSKGLKRSEANPLCYRIIL